MTDRKDGGQAFPVPVAVSSVGDVHDGYPGMTLRDWYAGQALVGIMSDPGMRPSTLGEFEPMAMRLFQVADAIIAEGEK